MNKVIVSGFIAACALFGATAANATVFSAWQVTNVAFGDTLNVRKYPANHSQKQSAYPNGKILQMTGRCTGGVDLHDIAHLSPAKQRNLVRYQWCQVWHDPAGNGGWTTGWVYGRYIRPY